MSDRYTNAPANQIKDRTLNQRELDITNTPSDGQFLKVNMPAGDFTAVDAPSIVDLTATVAVNQTNIVLNAFRIAIDASRSIFNMVDGIVDYFVDETGIDTVNSLNEDYDSVNDLYSPTASGGLDVSPYAHYKCNDDAASTVVTDDGTGSNNGTASVNTSTLTTTGKINEAFNFSADNINVDNLLTDISGDTSGSMSVWVKNAIGNYTILGAAIGISNRDLQFTIHADGTIGYLCRPIAGGASVHSVLTIDSDWNHIVLVHDGTAPKFYINGVLSTNNIITSTDLTVWFSSLALDNMDIGQRTGGGDQFSGDMDDFRYYQNKTLTSDEVLAIYNSGNGTEDDQPVGLTDNMTLISDTFMAEAEPDTARIVLLEEDVDVITLNTDLKAYATRDGGSNWVQGTLSDLGDFDSAKRILIADFTLANTGTSMEYKLTTLNNKDLKIHASSLNWD